jgi:imidazolonepropionase-like amidohydrolase
VDGTGAPALEAGLVVYNQASGPGEKGKLLYVGLAESCSINKKDGDIDVDFSGFTLLPGLINTHVHLWLTAPLNVTSYDPYGVPYRTLLYYRHLTEVLFTGVTTIRCVADSDDIDLALRRAVDREMLWGPRIVTCGAPLVPYGGHCHQMRGSLLCSGPEEFVKAARIQIGKGIDQVKLYYTGGAGGGDMNMFDNHITNEEAKAVCDLAHMLGKKVVAHLSNDFAVNNAIDCGVDSVEHAYVLNRDTAKKMAEKGVWYTPTITVSDVEEWVDNPSGDGFLPKQAITNLNAVRKRHLESLSFAIEEGIKITSGTDCLPSDCFHGKYAIFREMELFVQQGMTPLEAIRAATSLGAELCGLEKMTGTLKDGMLCDMIAIKGEPDRNIADFSNDKLKLVIHNGRTVWSDISCFPQDQSFRPLPPGTGLEGRVRAW